MHRARRFAGCWLAAMVVLASVVMMVPGQAARAADIATLIGGFEAADEAWTLGLGGEFPGAKGSFSRDSADAKSGSFSGLLHGDFSGGGNYVQTSRVMNVDLHELRLWVRTSDANRVGLRLTDSTGQVHQQRIALAGGGDWQQVVVTNFTGGEGYGHYGGANDGVWHGPATQVALLLDKGYLPAGQTSGDVRFDDITALAPAPDLAIEQTKVGNVFTGTEPAEFGLISNGDSVVWNVRDFTGNDVGSGTQAIDSAGRATLRVPVDRIGYYQLSVTAQNDGTTIATRSTTFARLAPFDISRYPDSPFGMGVRVPEGAAGLEVLSLLTRAGVKNLRNGPSWAAVERTKGQYDFSQTPEFFAALRDTTHQLMPVALYNNRHYDNNATPYTDEGRAGFASYAAAVSRQFADQAKWIEIYNEFNHPGFGDIGDGPADARADYYYPLLKASYEKVKAQNPNVTVVGGATAGVPLEWLEELFQLGGLQYMDVLSIHPYVYPGAPENAIQSLTAVKELVKKYNGGKLKPIWISEMGWPTHVGSTGVSEATQAANLVRSYVIALSQGVEKYFWYNFINDGLDAGYNEHNFGVVRYTTDPAGRWTPKPAYVSYAAMTRLLTGATYQRQEDVANGVWSFVFAKDGKQIRPMWSTTPTTVSVSTDKPITVTDLTGASATYAPQNGRVDLSLSGAPIYVAGDDVRVTANAKFSLTAVDGGTAVLGDAVKLNLTVDNTKAPKAAVRGTFEVAGESVPVSVGVGEKKTIPVTVPARSTLGRHDLVGAFVASGKARARLATQVTVVHPISVRAKHVVAGGADGTDVLRVTVRNLASEGREVGDLTWKVGDRNGTADLASPIPAGGRRTVDISLADLARSKTYASQLRVSVPGTTDIVVSGKVALVEHASMAQVTKKSIAVDGTLDDLSGVPGVDLAADGVVKMSGYGGTDDLSGNVWVTWDADKVYLSARIHDDTHFQPATESQIWNGDSIQFAIGGGVPGEITAWYEYGVALTSAGPQVYRWQAAEGSVGLVTDADLKVTRDDATKETTYELALPWTHVAPFQADDRLLGLSLLVNDNDGSGRKGYIEWGSGIGNSKDSSLFKPARLTD
ncbi:sugar-binding protein [Actinopolymorpha alba]|uniref:sugar-binding protein n=1 Tax=Actinopolymorpha alba TaxID=533267 RepID=UPI0003A14622|nr:sugar-binding protein [Actinopolymorpha alba]